MRQMSTLLMINQVKCMIGDVVTLDTDTPGSISPVLPLMAILQYCNIDSLQLSHGATKVND